MFNPSDYDDQSAINSINLNKETISSIVSGTVGSARFIADFLIEKVKAESRNIAVAFDGFPGARWDRILTQTVDLLTTSGIKVTLFDFRDILKPQEELDLLFGPYLANDREKDPVLLFGRLYDGSFEDLLDERNTVTLCERIQNLKSSAAAPEILIIYGSGCTTKSICSLYDSILYFDVSPKNVIIRIKSGLYKNPGANDSIPENEIIRRLYYIDYEIAWRQRRYLIDSNLIDFYIDNNDLSAAKLIPRKAFDSIMSALVKYPMRCKPVYIEGVWGGHFIKKLRNLPSSVRNCAWAYDLIPLEVSVLVKAGDTTIEFPFFTFVQKEGMNLMGEDCYKKFNGFFPVRMNYDDTWHGSGNMSVQIHPDQDYIVENFNEPGRQDESYYIVATGHNARTFVGFKDEADVDRFISETKRSEKEFTPVDYEKYINNVKSFPGVQVMLPAGTVHGSGRNQLVLETGSLTVGSYTFKLYDYLRPDLNGMPRPIHTYHGERVIRKGRTASWVKENLVKEPLLVRKGDRWAEYITGEHELLYFSLRRLEFEKEIEDDTCGSFHILTLVDGEIVTVQSLGDSSLKYEQHFLDVVIVPADVGKYIVRNEGNQPVCVHKVMLKQ